MDETALIRKYHALIWREVHRVPDGVLSAFPMVDRDDLYQAGALRLLQAARRNPDVGEHPALAATVIGRGVTNHLYGSGWAGRNAVYEGRLRDDRAVMALDESLGDAPHEDPEPGHPFDGLGELDPEERFVLLARASGYTEAEIGRWLGKTKGQVYYVVERVRRRVRASG